MPEPFASPSPFVGVLMLDTRFPRPPGDIGHPDSFARLGISAQYAVVRQASPLRAVQETAAMTLEPFVQAAQQLVARGASMITTSCGFLALHQRQLQRELAVPVLSSALLWLQRLVQDGLRPGVLTIDAQALGVDHFRGAGVSDMPPVCGVAPGCEFQRCILGNHDRMDLDQAGRDVVSAARSLVLEHPQVDCIVLECTNMPPYAEAVRQATGRRVEHLLSLIRLQWHTRRREPGGTA